MSERRQQLKHAFDEGIKTGWRAFLWMCKIVIPISFAMALLQSLGWLGHVSALLNPLMHGLNLPGEAALPIIVGMLVNIYGAIAVVAVLPFTVGQITLVAIFTLIAHSLVLEGIVQHKCGIGAFKSTAFRVGAAVATVFVVSRFVGEPTLSSAATLPAGSLSIDVVRDWALGTGRLLAKILGLIMVIMIAESTIKALGWLDRLLSPLSPVMRVMGLSRKTAFPWLTAVVFGLLYGGAVIVKDAKRGLIERHDLNSLHVSIGINHSMIEDPLLFAALGPNLLWLWIPRILAAAIAVHLLHAATLVGERMRGRTAED